MAKQYIFYKEDLINLLNNHKSFISKKVREVIAKGGDPRAITYKQSNEWNERFIEEMEQAGTINLEDILDEVDDILKKTMDKTVAEYAKEKISNIN